MRLPLNPSEPDFFERLKQRMLQDISLRMEGSFNRDSAADLQMFNMLFDELISTEQVVLSRAERNRLRDALLSSL